MLPVTEVAASIAIPLQIRNRRLCRFKDKNVASNTTTVVCLIWNSQQQSGDVANDRKQCDRLELEHHEQADRGKRSSC
jgi:hypothetical protein